MPRCEGERHAPLTRARKESAARTRGLAVSARTVEPNRPGRVPSHVPVRVRVYPGNVNERGHPETLVASHPGTINRLVHGAYSRER